MRLGTLVGIILIVLGVVGLAAGGFSFTRKEKIVDLGPIEATASTAIGIEADTVSPILSAR